MVKATTFRGLKMYYHMSEQDGLPFAELIEVTKDGRTIDYSVQMAEDFKKAIYGRIRLSELFESLGNQVSANFWRER